MADVLSLEQLVHLSLGDPEVGAVNFNVLKTLLLQMLKAMNLFHYKPLMSDDDQRTLKEALSISNGSENFSNNIDKGAERDKADRSSDRLNVLEEKVFRFESQINALKRSPSNSELIDRTKQQSKKNVDVQDETHPGPILELWQYTQMEKRLESAENGITRLASLLQDLLLDMNDLKESNQTLRQTMDHLKEQQEQLKTMIDLLNEEKLRWAQQSDLNELDEKLRNLQNLLASLQERLDGFSNVDSAPSITLPDLSRFVTVDQLENALRSIENKLNQRRPSSSAESSVVVVHSVDRQSQTSAKRKESIDGNGQRPSSSSIKNDHLEQFNNQYEKLQMMIDNLEKKKVNREELDALKNQQNDLVKRLAALEADIDRIRLHREPNSSGEIVVREIIKEILPESSNDLPDFPAALQRLREEFERLKQLVQNLLDKGNLNANDIDTLRKLIQHLEEIKADKNNVVDELDKKAEKRDLDHRLLKKDFQRACGELTQNINDCLQKFHVHDDVQKKDLEKINVDINEKLDRSELDALRDYMDKQMKKFKKLAKEQQTQQQHVHVMSEDEAAGLRKQLIRFHCISCDRPIDVQPHPQQPSLPVNQGMRPIQSPRPYTTYELDQIRQYQKNQQFSCDYIGGVGDVYSTIRQCGGSHTTTLPFKRQLRTQQPIPEEHSLVRNEVDIKGHDGVIYKGRIDVDKLPALDIHKKNSVVLLAPPPPAPPRSRLDAPTTNHHHHPHPHLNMRELPNNQDERDDSSTMILNLEPSLPREESLT